MDRTTRFWDRIADSYSEKPIADQANYERKLAVSREYFDKDMQVFEFGCGTGSTALLHAPYVGHVLGTDISPRMIEIAREKAGQQAIDNVTFEAVSLEEANVEEGSMDIVLGLSILHLLDNPKEAIRRVSRMLKPGGVFISSTACLGDKLKIFKYIGPVGAAIGLLPKLSVFTLAELQHNIRDAGFEIEQQWQPGKTKGAFIVARKLNKH